MLAGGEMKYPQWSGSKPGTEPKPELGVPEEGRGDDDRCRRHAALSERVGQMTSRLRAGAAQGGLPRVFPTVGHAAVYFMASHEMYHLGQLSVWRNAAGIG